MITDPARTVVLSSLGWVEGDAIWCFDVASGVSRTIPMNTGARHSSLHAADNERFVNVHHFDGARFLASVSLFSAPEVTVSSVSYENGRSSIGGNADAWDGMPRLFVEYLREPWNDYVLLSATAHGAFVQRFEWYDSSFDKGYQSVVDVVTLPDPRYALVSVQRSSVLIVHDLQTGKAHHRVTLGAQQGNPKLALRNGGTEVWASDYDTLVVIDAQTWRVLRKQKLQKAPAGTQQFIGEYSFAKDGACCVARPHNGDVVKVNERLKIQKVAKLGRQPFEAIELSNGDVIARDWKTGDLLKGRFEKQTWLQGLFG